MSNITARYVDTCLSDYLQDSYSRDGQTLLLCSLGTNRADTAQALVESMDMDAGVPESVTDDQIFDAVNAALEGVDLRYIDEDGNRQDEPAEDRDGDEPYLYVVLEWDATKAHMRLTLDVEYLTNGTDTDTLKQLLENIARFAASDGLMTGGTDAEVEQWGATAEPVERHQQGQHLTGVRGE